MKHFDPRKIKGTLVRAGVATKEAVIGCSTLEIRALEKERRVKLPGAYKEFLRIMGHGAGEFASDCMWKYVSLADIEVIASRGSTKDAAFSEYRKARETAFAFFLLQEDFFLFFYTNQGHDPPVWTSEHPQQPFFPSFSSWLWAGIDEQVAWQQLKKRRSLSEAIAAEDHM